MKLKRKIYAFALVFVAISIISLIFLDELAAFDAQLTSIMAGYSTPILNTIFLSITYLGSIIFWLLIVALLWLKKDRKLSTFLLIALIIDFILIGLLKLTFSRARPNLGSIQELSPGFPSGHTSRVFLGATLIKYYRPLLIIIAVLVAFSRLYLGVHYFSDVLFGALIGISIALIIRLIPDKKVERFLKKISKKL